MSTAVKIEEGGDRNLGAGARKSPPSRREVTGLRPRLRDLDEMGEGVDDNDSVERRLPHARLEHFEVEEGGCIVSRVDDQPAFIEAGLVAGKIALLVVDDGEQVPDVGIHSTSVPKVPRAVRRSPRSMYLQESENLI